MVNYKLMEEIRGLVFSTDLMMALIIITVVLGVSADAMDSVVTKIQYSSYANSVDRMAVGAADMLIKNPGTPENWEELGNFNGVTPGLAHVNRVNSGLSQKILSLKKINSLKENYDELMRGRVLPPYHDSSLTICPVDPSMEPITMGKISPSSSDIIVVNRTVLCNFYNTSILVFIEGMTYNSSTSQQKFGGNICPHQDIIGNPSHIGVDYKNKRSGWACYHFRVTRNMLNSRDFYLMTDPVHVPDNSAVWIIDCSENSTEDSHPFSNQPILVNDFIRACIGNKTTCVLWLHVFSCGNSEKAFNTYLAGYPKGTPVEKAKIQYLTPQPCYFLFKVST